MARKKREQHESTGVDAEVQDLFSDDDENLPEPFVLPEARKHADPPVKTEEPNTADEEKVNKDAEYARNNLYELIEHGMAAIQDLSTLSREQMHPRTYEVLSKLMKDVAANNVALIELANQKKEAKKKEGQPSNNGNQPQVNNIDKAIFVGTTSELLKEMNKAKG